MTAYHPEVKGFYEAYTDYLKRVWTLQDPVGELTGWTGTPGEEFRIRPPGLAAKEMEVLDELLPAGVYTPQALRVFLMSHRHVEFGAPWIAFYPTAVDEFDETVAVVRHLAPQRLLAFATDDTGGISFCLDLREDFDGQDASIVLVRPLPDWKQEVIGPLFSSFSSLLKIMTEFMNDPVSDDMDKPPFSDEQVELVRRLKSMDPEGFGGKGWELWWSQLIFRGHDPT